ncbi:c-type cytochrome [Salinibacter sp.]|uniref:c-type cytochrome n=1 Tax=Salinibacter sp. TaxID=2065818 RepID=UPI002FC36ABA
MNRFFCTKNDVLPLAIASCLLVAALCAGCTSEGQPLSGSPNNGGLLLPNGFEAIVVADSIGPARHLAVRDNGDIYAKLKQSNDDGSIVALRDTTEDGRADVIRTFGVFSESEGNFQTGAEIRDGHLYVSTDLRAYRYELVPGQLVPDGPPDTLFVDEGGLHQHIAKPLSFDAAGNMYIPYGAPSNACQDPKRTPGVAGQDPCPELDDHAGIWRFDGDKLNQTQANGQRVGTGLRSVVAMDWNPTDGHLYSVVHGRDNLHRLWPEKYTPWENAMLPAAEFVRVSEGSNFGWPYCYYDQMQGKKVLAPEYGGDGDKVGRCRQFDDPVIGFPGHFAPNGLMFYQGQQFPDHYENGAFIAFHGSTIRNPYPQAGYFVAFVPFEDGKPSGEWEVFANGFAGVDPIVNTSDAEHRPGGLATGPDGSLYITEDNDGKIWRVIYTGGSFTEADLARMEKEKKTASNIRTPHKEKDNLRQEMLSAGEEVYVTNCAACHQRDGKGAPPRYPTLAGTEWVTGDKQRLISVIVNGLEGPIEVKGKSYSGAMPSHDFLSDEEVAEVATFIRQNFGNDASAVSTKDVRRTRNAPSTDD